MGVRSLADVLNDHLRLRKAGDLDADLARNYAEDVIVLSKHGVFRGHGGVRESAAILRREVPNARFDYHTRFVEREMGFLLWSATGDGSTICDGADSYLIRNGRIELQTIFYVVHSNGR